MVRSIVFDIGWVLVRFNYRPIIALLQSRGADVHDRYTVMERLALAEHECGRVHGLGFLERIRALARAPISLEEAHAHWVNMFELEPVRRRVEVGHVLGLDVALTQQCLSPAALGAAGVEPHGHRLGHAAILPRTNALQ